MPSDVSAETPARPTSTSLADALVEIAESYSAGKTGTSGSFTFFRPDGKPIPDGPSLPEPDGPLYGEHDAEITPQTIVPPWYGERLDLDYAIAVLFGNQQARQARREAALAA